MKNKTSIKNVLILTIIAITITMISLFFINISLASNSAKIVVETANLRETASTNSKILELVNKNENVEVLEKNGEWTKVKYKGIEGYIKTELINIKQEEKNEEKPVEPESKVQNIEMTENKVENNEEIKGKYKVKEDTTLKVIPLINSLDVEKINKDTEIELIDIMNNWANIIVNGRQGWVRYEKLEKILPIVEPEKKVEQEQEEPKKTEQVSKKMYINSETVNVRSKADKNSNLVMQIAKNEQVEVLAAENGWSKIKYNNKEGYILSSLLSTKKQETTRGMEGPRKVKETKQKNNEKEEPTKNDATSTNKGASIVEYAKQFIGTKYVSGGNSPKTGFDCSGFTSYVYKHFGISLPRTADAQAKVGTPVNRANLQPGDLVCYKGHVAIYVGNGNVIHAPRPGKKVCIVSLDYAGHGFIGGRRIVN